MRRWLLLLLLAGLAGQARAARNVSVSELEQLLNANQGKSDRHVADILSDVTMTERISTVRLARWEKQFPGSHTHAEFMKLADMAAFLNLPGEDIPRDPAPDIDTQSKMFALAVDNVKTLFTRLPNFYATRFTTHFEDLPLRQSLDALQNGPVSWRGHSVAMAIVPVNVKLLHVTGTYSTMVRYRDGAEVHGVEGDQEKKPEQTPPGMTTIGEFGPMLAVILHDAAYGQVTWGHWEQGATDPIAVFRYVVPDGQSHYAIGIPEQSGVEQVYPPYHGEIAVDPETGDISRVSAIVDMRPPHETIETAVQVDYAPQTIGTRTYICPVHGVAFSKVPSAPDSQGTAAMVTVQTQLNDVEFTQYHLFGSESHIVTGAGSQGTSIGAGPDAAAAPVNENGSAGQAEPRK